MSYLTTYNLPLQHSSMRSLHSSDEFDPHCYEVNHPYAYPSPTASPPSLSPRQSHHSGKHVTPPLDNGHCLSSGKSASPVVSFKKSLAQWDSEKSDKCNSSIISFKQSLSQRDSDNSLEHLVDNTAAIQI